MATKIMFEADGTKYTLEYSKKTVKALESRGFNIRDVQAKPMTLLPLLFEGAFALHHPKTSSETIQKIFGRMNDREALFDALVGMYNAPIEGLFEDPDEEKNVVSWTQSE